MIEKMKYISLMAKMSELDYVIERYISKYDIQLEHASKDFHNVEALASFSVENPYAVRLKKAEIIMNNINLVDSPNINIDIGRDRACTIIDTISCFLDSKTNELLELETKREEVQEIMDKLSRFEDLQCEMQDIHKFSVISYKFGRMPASSFMQFETFLYDDSEILFIKGSLDKEYFHGVYFTPLSSSDKVDTIFSSLHFEEIAMPFSYGDIEFVGTPATIHENLINILKPIENEILKIKEETISKTEYSLLEIVSAYSKINELSHYYDSRQYAAKVADGYFIFVGWMAETEALELNKDLSDDENVMLIMENESDSMVSKPPTKLKNLLLIKPFEFFVRLYGMPSYNELDPTPFLAITYTIFFGMMFGDLGQGFLLALLGIFLSTKTSSPLGAIISTVGCSAMFFGIMYGSFFGYEDLLFKHVWLSPLHDITTILITTVGFGVVIVLICMIFNIINAIKKKRIDKLFFDPNGIVGLALYVSILLVAGLVFIGKGQLALWIGLIAVGIPLVLVAFREPLNRNIQKKKLKHKVTLGLFLLETIMELIEVLLSYFTNTVSFVRIGGFAISHAGLMAAVMMLSGAENGNPNYIIIILGNLFVMCLEGVVVAIQVLRLQFYEMFSRYYEGNGTEFVSYRSLLKKINIRRH